MFDPKTLLDQVLGSQAGGGLRNAGQSAKGHLDQYSGSGGFARGAAAGGLLGLLLGGKGVGKMASGALGYGGAAVLGALALKAYQDYQSKDGQNRGATPPTLTPEQFAALSPEALPHARPAADGGPFQLVLIRAMVAAAKADGHVDAAEQQRLFAEVERFGLDAEAKAFVFDLLTQPVDLGAITNAVATPEQGAEVYLASRLAIDPDVPAERAYLDALATRLRLPSGLREQLDAQTAPAGSR
jgi:uncharacterized membrane protein YebE (DUF533 family)